MGNVPFDKRGWGIIVTAVSCSLHNRARETDHYRIWSAISERFFRFSHEEAYVTTESNFAKLVFNLPLRQLIYQDKPIPLTKLEFDLLAYLLHHKTRVCTYDELLDNVWQYSNDAGSVSLVHITVCHIRQKLRDCQISSSTVQTVRGVGLHINADIFEIKEQGN
jgi:DNA-binding response OmpR family regulator